MRRILLVISLLSLLTLPLLPAPAYAQFEDVCDGTTTDASICNTTGRDPIAGEDGILKNVLLIFSYVVGVAAVIMVIIGGLKFITANGDPNSITSARNTVLYALLGVIIFLASQAIVRFVIGRV